VREVGGCGKELLGMAERWRDRGEGERGEGKGAIG